MGERCLRGLGVSEGIAVAQALVLADAELKPAAPEGPVDAAAERERFRQAVAELEGRLSAMIEAATGEAAEIFDTHLSIIGDDDCFLQPVCVMIEENNLEAAAASDTVLRELAESFAALDDEYMRQRAADLNDLNQQMLGILLGVPPRLAGSLPGPCIVVARDITPSDTARMDFSLVRGLVSEIGGPASHTSVIARAMGIPAVVGAQGAVEAVRNGGLLALDGGSGELWVDPAPARVARLEALEADRRAESERLERLRGLPSETVDGHRVILAANVGTPAMTDAAARGDAEGIGLLRSEFLYLDGPALPSEEQQCEAYRYALRKFAGRRVIVRTLDVGGDKQIPALPLPGEDNPFLGNRAIRLCLRRPELFRTQLRALLRAAADGDLAVMVPMISGLEELRRTKELLESARRELEAEGLPHAARMEVGMMIEIPSSALMASEFAAEVDFFSIGTNDLVQYTLAVDRGNAALEELYDPCHPAVLRLVRMTAEAAHGAGIACNMCGEAACDPLLVPLWIGMGLHELSMSASAILKTRGLVRALSRKACEALVGEVLTLGTAGEVRARLERFAREFREDIEAETKSG